MERRRPSPAPEAGAQELSPSPLEQALLSALGAMERSQRSAAIGGAAQVVDPDRLVEAMSDHVDSRRRNAAMEALARGGSRSVPALVRALRHPDPEVVMFSAGVLARTGSAAAIPHLVSLLEHADVNVAQQAVDSLSQMRSPLAVDALIPVLGREPWLRFAAVHALGEIGDRRAVGALAKLLDDLTVRDTVVEALGKIGSADALDHLFRVLMATAEGESFAICLRAIGQALESERSAEALDQLAKWAEKAAASASALEERLTRVLLVEPKQDVLGGGPDARKAAAVIVKALRMQPLYTAMVLAGRDPAISEVLEMSAVSIGADIAPTLEMALGAGNVAVRVLACECLGSMGHLAAAPGIESLLADAEPRVRAAAVRALMRLGQDSAIPAIGRMLGDPDEGVRQTVGTALCRMDVEAVTDVLLANAVPRESALVVMAANPHPRQNDFVHKTLSDPSPSVRRAAVQALARQGSKEAADRLEALLADPDGSVRRAVVEALAPLPVARLRRRLVEHARGDAETRAATVCALVTAGDSTLLPFLNETFDQEPVSGQLAILRAITGRPDSVMTTFLTRQLGHREPSVRSQVVLALGKLLSTTVIRTLVTAARDHDPSVRSAVIEVLGSCSDPAARDALTRLTLDHDQGVAVAARHRVERAAQAALPPQRSR
jgi:HEAT repeat protein